MAIGSVPPNPTDPAQLGRPRVDDAKIVSYLMKFRETDDKSKCFINVLGYIGADPQRLKDDLLGGFSSGKLLKVVDRYNSRSKAVIAMELGAGRRILTDAVWEIDNSSGTARFITACAYHWGCGLAC